MTLVLIGLAWVIGLAPVAAFDAPWWMGAAWLLAAAPLLALRRTDGKAWAAAAVCILGAGIAGLRLSTAVSEPAPAWAEFAVGNEVAITGVIDSEPDRGQTTTGYVLKVESISLDANPLGGNGKVLVHLHQYAEYLPGDHLAVSGKLEEPPVFDGFDYRGYLARRGISGTLYRPSVREIEAGGGSPRRWLTEQRLRLDRALQRVLPEPESSLAAGIAFGRDDGLSREAKDRYNRSGLRHLVAVSGSNVSLVAVLTYALAIPLVGRKWAWIPAALTLVAYLGAAGLAASVLRSGIMAMVLLAGRVIGRPQSGLPGLSAAVLGMTVITPGLALDPGFQLSASATAGLITLSPWLQHWLLWATGRTRWSSIPRWTCEGVAFTIAATVSTLPVMWVTFGEVSVVSPIANVVVQPVFALAFWASLGTAVLGAVDPRLGELAALPAYYPLAFIEASAEFFSRPSWASIDTPDLPLEIPLVATTVLVGMWLLGYRFGPPQLPEGTRAEHTRASWHRLLYAGAAGAVAIAIIPISLLSRGGPGELVVAFLDVGQGDAALVTTPHGQQILIDGGPSGPELVRELGEVMPHWDRSLDRILLSHPQEDHFAGLLEVLRRFSVVSLTKGSAANNTVSYRLLEMRSGETTIVAGGFEFTIDGVRFEVLGPPPGHETENLNDQSLIVRITYGEISFLFTGDAEGPALEGAATAGSLRADVLKVPHHGSRTTPAEFFSSVRPAVAVISVGEGNVYGHPHLLTLDALAELEGARTYRTDLSGRVTIRTKGSSLKVATER